MVELDRELEGRREAEDEGQGAKTAPLTPCALDADFLAPKKEYGRLQRILSPEEWSRQARAFAESNRGAHIPPDEALTREAMYADHD